MSTFACEVVPIRNLRPHPNADTLSIVDVLDGFPCIVRTEEWARRDRGVYIPVDAVVPDAPEFAFLGGHRRIKAKKLRGIFSMGLLVEAREGWGIGDDVTALLGVTKHDPDQFTERGSLSTGGDDAPAPPCLAPAYTDIESLRRYRHVLAPGEPIIATEKIHGANARYLIHDGALHCGSRTRWKREDERSIWWRAARQAEMAERLPAGFVFYGEVYGQVQDLRYGASGGEVRFRAFDVLEVVSGHYLDHVEAMRVCFEAGLEVAPVLYAGPYNFDALADIAERDSIVDGCGGIREGVVVRPIAERFHERVGRVIFKLHSQRYLLRKGA